MSKTKLREIKQRTRDYVRKAMRRRRSSYTQFDSIERSIPVRIAKPRPQKIRDPYAQIFQIDKLVTVQVICFKIICWTRAQSFIFFSA